MAGHYGVRYFPEAVAEVDAAITVCIAKLMVHHEQYTVENGEMRRMRQWRGLFVAACTLNTSAAGTIHLVRKGKLVMDSARRFMSRREGRDPWLWGPSPKSCFARALCGFTLGPDAVCIDRHLERLRFKPENAPDQWRAWFLIYLSLYGPARTEIMVRWHHEILEWIAGERETPP